MKFLKLFLSLFCILMLVSFVVTAAGQDLLQRRALAVRTLVKAELISSAKHYIGVCPVTVTMTGKITVSKAMTVNYHFLRSDGVTTRLTPLIFTGAGSKSLPFSWILDKDGQAWVQLVVEAAASEVKSEKVEFRVKCDEEVRKNLTAAQIKEKSKPVQIGQAKIINHKLVLKQADNIPTTARVVSDLSVSYISIQPDPGKFDENVTFLFTIKNSSNVRTHSPACKLKIVFSYPGDNPYYGDYEGEPYFYDIPEIWSMDKCTIEVIFRFRMKTCWRVRAKADGENSVNEFNEDNNTRKAAFCIGSFND